MSIDKAVLKFDNLLEEVKSIMPTVILSDGSVGYHNYIIKKNKIGQWDLMQVGRKYKNYIGTYNLKTSALMAAKHHKNNRVMQTFRIKDLDHRYWASYTDSIHFKELISRTNDLAKKDIYLWRYEQTRDRATYYKGQITQAFNYAFR